MNRAEVRAQSSGSGGVRNQLNRHLASGSALPDKPVCAHAVKIMPHMATNTGNGRAPAGRRDSGGRAPAISEIRAIDPNARIIVLTTFDGDEDIYRGMRVGAKSYLLKDVRREELFQRIREVHAGRTFLPPAVAAKLAERLTGDELSPRELEVLRLLAQGKPNKLIGADLAITEVTVKSHVQSVFRKLNVLSRTEAIAVATRRGLLR